MAQPKKIKSNSCPLPSAIAVLDDEYYENVKLIDAFIGRVTTKSHIGQMIQDMKNILPMPNPLNHLKRVKGNEVILTLLEDTNKNQCLEFIKQKLPYLEPIICSAKVPLGPLKTKKQHLEANSYWPCSFHPNKTIEQMLSNQYFTAEDTAKQYDHMKLALKCAREKVAEAGAIIVDPKNNRVIATGVDDRSKNPAHHAVIKALDEVAKSQCANVDDCSRNNEELPYLCTGYDIYVTREPCLMCAMAMVHCRIRRVFYGCQSASGALGSLVKLHSQKQLNHHYLVFKGILKDECEALQKVAI